MNQKISLNKSSMLYWWPRVQDLKIPMPKTIIAKQQDMLEWIEVLDGLNIVDETWNHIENKADEIGYPLFMRTDLSSFKHQYKETCFVTKKEDITRNILYLIDSSFARDIGLEAIVLREFLDLVAPFKAFMGLPIAKERRYFAEDGRVFIHHPYWPEDAIRFYRQTVEPDNWQELLADINKEHADEIELLTSYAEQISTRLEGQWSIDFAQAKDGTWYFIDAAEAMKSWIHPDYAKDKGWGK